MKWHLILLLFLFSTAWALDSPRLARLEEELSGAALEAFWAEVEESGGPLIEEWEEGTSLVTFVYQGRGDERHVVLSSSVLACDPAECLMERFGGTDLWFRSVVVDNEVRTKYTFVVNGSLVPFSTATLEEFLEEQRKDRSKWRADPFNGKGGEDYSVLEMPEAPEQRWVRRYVDMTKGAVAGHKLTSEILGNRRKMRVYVPPHYSEEQGPYPLVVLFDGAAYDQAMMAPVIFDNLVGAGLVPPFVAVLVGNVNQASRREELPCSPTFGRFIVEEVLPWVHERYKVSAQPSDVVIGGASFGGLAAAYLALEYPEYFGNVLSQSGSFLWKPVGEERPSWLVRQYREREPVDVRFYLDVGSLETFPFFGGPSLLESNREMRDVLLEKGYEVSYDEFKGGHDYVCWRGTLSEGLISLLSRED